jgi:vacuolar-type H+-ATPase subunit F/Vma7
MSKLLILTRPSLVTGFLLAGVEAFAAEDAADCAQRITTWLDTGEKGLLAIDSELLEGLDPALRERLESSETLPVIAIPSGLPGDQEDTRKKRIARMIRNAIGFDITLKGEDAEATHDE